MSWLRPSPLPLAILLLFAGWSLGLTACAVTAGSPRETVGEAIQSTAISHRIQIKFKGEPAVNSLRIGVHAFKGAVILHGAVANDEQRGRLLQLAGEVPGVKEVLFLPAPDGRAPASETFGEDPQAVWEAVLVALRSLGYRVDRSRSGAGVVATDWNELPPSLGNLWRGARARVYVAVQARGSGTAVYASPEVIGDGEAALIRMERGVLAAVEGVLAGARAAQASHPQNP